MPEKDKERLTYAGAGVDIAAGEEAVRRIRDHVRSTFRPEVIGDIGGFGGLFAFQQGRYKHPVLVSSTDGVGTKALIAQAAGRFTTIGVDLVAMCVDDLVCQGAEPLFFLDYIAVGQLNPDHIDQLVSGIAEGCRVAGCALIGGEMAEHPGAMKAGEFDLVGFAVGAVERDRVISGANVHAGDILIGLPSPNLRSNGYSLARKALLEVDGRSLDDEAYPGARHSLADELLSPSVIYAPAILELLRHVDVHAAAHITGGGIVGNLNRVLPDKCDAVVQRRMFETPRIFSEIQRVGEIPDAEMARDVQSRPRHDRGRPSDRRVQGARRPARVRAYGGAGGRDRRRRPRQGALVLTDVKAALVEHLLKHSVRTGDFTLKSGRKSPYFIDSKQTACRPDGILLVARAVLELVPADATAIGGLTMGADPVAFATATYAATVGRSLKAFSVRKEVKDHGGGGRIAGALDAGDRVVLTEDTASRGTSILEAAEAVREAGAEPILMLALVDRGGTAAAIAAAAGIPFAAVVTGPDLGFPYDS